MLSQYLENSPLAVIEWDREHRIVRWTGEATRVFGWTAEEALGKEADDLNLVYEPDVPIVRRSMAENLSGAGVHNVTRNRNVRKDGAVIHCEWYNTMLRDGAGRLVGVLSQALDVTEQHRAEEEVLWARQLLGLHVEQTPLAVVEWTIEGRVRGWNPSAERIFGFSREEVLGRDWSFFVPEELRRKMEGVWETLVARRGGTRSTNENLTKDGRRIICEWFSMPLVAPDGSTIGVASLVMDVTERVRAQEELQESNELLSLFLRHSPVYAFIKEVSPTQSRVLRASENYRDMVGVPGSKMTGMTMENLFPPEFAEKITADDWAVVSGGEVLQLDEDLEGRHYTTIKYPITVGGRRLLAGYTLDITERRRAEEALRQSKERYRSIVESQIEFVDRYGPGGILTYVNESLARAVGMKAEDLLGKSFYPFVHEADRGALIQAIESLSRKEPVCTLENRVLMPDGRVCWHQWTHAALFDAEGALVEYQSIGRDVTERKRLEEERRELDAHLRRAQKMEAIGTLAGGIAHDFNNILTPVIAHAELALMKFGAQDPAREDIEELLVAAHRAAELARQILVISRKEPDGTLVPVPLGSLVKEVAKFLRSSLPTTIDIQVKTDAGCGPVLGDGSQLHQVLLNLCTNAGYAMRHTGGVLSLSVEHRGGAPGGGLVALTVRDTGEGIPQETVDRIFEPYFTTKPVGAGSGLGLAVVHGIVTKLGGTIDVKSVPGEGTVFEILLPEYAESDVAGKPSVPEIPRGQGQRVLVVDDEVSVAGVLRKMLVALGYQATEARGSAEALAAFKADPQAFDAVMTDYTMPGMTGLSLAAELLGIRRDLPILLATGFSEGVDGDLVAANGLRGLVRKPYTMQSVGEALRQALGA